MSVTLSTIGSRGLTITVSPSALREAPDGIAIELTVHDGPLVLTLTQAEALSLVSDISGQLAHRKEAL